MCANNINRPRLHLISRLYDAKPNICTTCGRRFDATPQGKEKKARHMDWHFKMKDPDAAKRGVHRSWYFTEKVRASTRKSQSIANHSTRNGSNIAKSTRLRLKNQPAVLREGLAGSRSRRKTDMCSSHRTLRLRTRRARSARKTSSRNGLKKQMILCGWTLSRLVVRSTMRHAGRSIARGPVSQRRARLIRCLGSAQPRRAHRRLERSCGHTERAVPWLFVDA